MSVVPVKSSDLDAAEVAWFSALCSDDFEYLGVPEDSLKSSWPHCRDIQIGRASCRERVYSGV